MYNLGENFINRDTKKLKSLDKVVFRGNKYRISVLTERLVRLEYNNDGVFNDRETCLVKNRLFEYPDFNVKQDDNYLVIETRYFTLTYIKNSTFSSRSLVAQCNGKKDGWYYGQSEVRNLNSCTVSLDNCLNLPKLEKGLFSLEGIATIDDSSGLRFDENSNFIYDDQKGNIDMYLFIYGKDFGLCLMDFYRLSSMPPMIPRYALGNWWSKEEDYRDIDILNLIERFEVNKIPLSVFLLDNGWAKRDLSKFPNIKTGFSFNTELIPNPVDLINKIHAKNIKIGLKINPQFGFYPFEDNYETARKYLEANRNGVINFDPLNLKDIDVFFKIFLHPLMNYNIDFFWNDYFDKDKNKIYLLDYYLSKDSISSNKRYLSLMRNSTYNGHLRNVLYSGKNPIDWNTLKFLPFYNLNSANIGISFWSHDVGGSIGGIEDYDFYLRSVEFGVFSPIFRFNTEKGRYFKREPWKWDVVTNSIASYYLRLRHRLIPYIYSEAYQYHKKGQVLVQPFYYYNINVYDDENYVNQYYFGKSFMISPIIKPMDEVINRTIQKFYIPNGVWYDFKTGKRFLGNHKYVAFYSIDDYPIFVKQGSIIPMAADDSYMSVDIPKTLEIHVFPGENNTYYLYEDDGETNGYLNGRYCITEIDYNYRTSNYTIIIRCTEGDRSIVPAVRNYRIVFRNTKQADNVVVYENEKVFENITTEKNETDFIVNISNVNTASQLVVNCYGKDIEIDSIKLIKDDIESIISDLKINTVLKDDIANIVFDDNLSLGKKRIGIKKLKRKGLDARSVKIFLRLLEYMEM